MDHMEGHSLGPPHVDRPTTRTPQHLSQSSQQYVTGQAYGRPYGQTPSRTSTCRALVQEQSTCHWTDNMGFNMDRHPQGPQHSSSVSKNNQQYWTDTSLLNLAHPHTLHPNTPDTSVTLCSFTIHFTSHQGGFQLGVGVVWQEWTVPPTRWAAPTLHTLYTVLECTVQTTQSKQSGASETGTAAGLCKN